MSIPSDSYWLDARWDCKPEISNTQDSSAVTRRRMSNRYSGNQVWHSRLVIVHRKQSIHSL